MQSREHTSRHAPRVLLHAGLVVESSSNCTFDSLSIHGTGREGVRLRFNSTNNVVQASAGLEQGWGRTAVLVCLRGLRSPSHPWG